MDDVYTLAVKIYLRQTFLKLSCQETCKKFD